jgi:hypothetical protein
MKQLARSGTTPLAGFGAVAARRFSVPTAAARPCTPAPRRRGARVVAAAAAAAAGPRVLRPAVIICPGFLSDYRGRECGELAENLSRHLADGTKATAQAAAGSSPPAGDAPDIQILPIRRSAWYPTLNGGSFGFYLDALAEAVAAAGGSNRGGGVSLVALSAAGWLARLALGAEPYEGKVAAATCTVEGRAARRAPSL